MTRLEALLAALAAERQAVYGYGVGGAHLSASGRRLARAALAAHQARRDRLVQLVTAAGATSPPEPSGYRLPFAVVDRTSAATLLARIEDGCAGAAWDLCSASAPGDDARRLAVAWLGEAASRAAHWRDIAQLAAEPALPGKPH
jgi:hypothetical protein